MKTMKRVLAAMYLEGVRVSGRALTLGVVRAAFEAGYDAGAKEAKRRKVRR